MKRSLVALLGLTFLAACSAAVEDDEDGEAVQSTAEALTTCNVDPFRELEIVHPSVTDDASASGTGHWSFGFLMKQLAPAGTDPADFVEAWISQWRTVKSVGSDPVSPRNPASFLGDWKRKKNGKLDLDASPMKLLAIVYRPDLATKAKPAGEGRFVFGVKNSPFSMEPMTVILEYALPTSATLKAETWAKRFHALGTTPFGATYNKKLQAITDDFVRSLAQVRTNELLMSDPWQLREFTLQKGALKQTTVKETPDHTNVRQMSALAKFASDPANFATLRKASFSFGQTPELAAMLGGNSDENGERLKDVLEPLVPKGRNIPADIVKKIAQNRCDGCHNSEAADMGGNLSGFYHISPFVDTTSNVERVSGFIRADLKKVRVPKLKRLACGVSSAAEADEDEETVRVH